MCGRFVSTNSAEELAAFFGATADAETPPESFNVAPTDDVLAVVNVGGDNRAVRAFHWGLVPLWAKDTKIASSLINARAETIDEKAAFKNAFRKYRCII